jgi:hypothetical protein
MDEAEFMLTHIEDSLEMRAPYAELWKEIENNRLVRPARRDVPNFLKYGGQATHTYFTNPPNRGYSLLKDPESHQINESLTTQGLAILLSDGYLTAIPRGYDDPEKARLIANMLMAIMDQPGNYGSLWRLFGDTFGYGISYMQVGWEERSRMQMTEIQPGVWGPGEVLYRQQPRLDVIDHYDVYPDRNGTRIHVDMERIAKRFRISPSQALAMAEAGIYDMEATRRALAKHADGRPGTAAPHGDERFAAYAEMVPRNKGMIYGFEMYGQVPLKYPDKATNRFITMLNGEIVRSHINPFRDGEIPIVDFVVNPITGRHYGMSPLEAVRFLQDSTDMMLMSLTDSSNYMVRPNLLVGSFGGDPNQLRRREENDLIFCRDVKQVAPVPTDFSALSWAMQELTRRKMSMREAAGAPNPMQNIPSDRATATEISELTRLASQRIDVMTRLLERDPMPILGRLIHSRLRQFIPPDSDMVAVLNGEPVSVPFEAIDIDADIRFGGSTMFMSKFQKGAQMREFLNILGQFPELLITAPELIVQYGRDILGVVDAEPIVAKMAARQVMMLQQQQMAAGPNTGAQEEPFGTQAGETQREGQMIA